MIHQRVLRTRIPNVRALRTLEDTSENKLQNILSNVPTNGHASGASASSAKLSRVPCATREDGGGGGTRP